MQSFCLRQTHSAGAHHRLEGRVAGAFDVEILAQVRLARDRLADLPSPPKPEQQKGLSVYKASRGAPKEHFQSRATIVVALLSRNMTAASPGTSDSQWRTPHFSARTRMGHRRRSLLGGL
jgi:hypothetical protein